MARNAAARAQRRTGGRRRRRKTKRSMRTKFQIDEHWVASSAATSTLKPSPPRNADERERVDDDAAQPDEAEAAEARAQRAEAEAPDQREVARDLPHGGLALACRPDAEVEGNLRDRELRRADEDLEQDLEAVGAQDCEVERVAPHEEEPGERVGDAVQARREREAGEQRRAGARSNVRTALSPAIEPPLRKRDATTRSLFAASACSRSAAIVAGGCWRSASMTQTQGARAAAMPATTAPPSPPSRSPCSRWMSATSSARPDPRSATTRGVASSESSTTISSACTPESASSRLSMKEPMTACSLRVGATTVSSGVVRVSRPAPVRRGALPRRPCPAVHLARRPP